MRNLLLVIIAFLLATPGNAQAMPMSFRIAKDGEANAFQNSGYDLVVIAKGLIDDQASGRAELFFKTQGVSKFNKRLIMLESPGGDLSQGMALARLFRKHRFDTALHGDCESACVSAYAGGVWRYYSISQFSWSKHDLKVHRFFGGNGNDLGQTTTQIVAGEWVNFFNEMGVNPLIFTLISQFENSTSVTHEISNQLQLTNDGSGPVKQKTYIDRRRVIFELSKSNYSGRFTVKTICDMSAEQGSLSFIVVGELDSMASQGFFRSSPYEVDYVKGFFEFGPASSQISIRRYNEYPVTRQAVGQYSDGVKFKTVEFGGKIESDEVKKMVNSDRLNINLVHRKKDGYGADQIVRLPLGEFHSSYHSFVNECYHNSSRVQAD